ncbi:hypothetical protein DPMN_148184 [Dreissena polymorpha]|uniref:Uncharacterized protein n=1 Tax=Dreissena polymorpha TaxID=45954 RepID=A0A9D4J433_DREPO|nr:hypothetical protein DPMN_148184 [Dreissena polymorpha]
MNLLIKFHEDRTVNVDSRENAPPLGSHLFKANTNLLTRFHEDWTINVASRPFKEKCPAPGGHVFKTTKTIFELIQDIIGTNLLTKIHDDRKINVTSRVLTRFYNSHIRKNSPPPKNDLPLGSHVFQAKPAAKATIFELIQDIINTNLLTNFHEDRKINVASRVLTRKNAPPPGGHVFQPTGIIFKLVQDIIGINLLTKFHKDWTINVASRVKNAPPLGSHVFQAKVTILKLIQDTIGTHHQSKFHEDLNINVASTVLTRKNAPPPGGHVFQPTDIIFKLVQNIIGMNLLTKFYEDRTINVASRVKNAPPLGTRVFKANTNFLTKFHEDWTINVASRENCHAPWRPCFFTDLDHFRTVQDINETNVLTKLYDDWAKIVTSRVFTRNTAPPPGGHTNILTKLHEDWASNVSSTHDPVSNSVETINVASRVFTRQNVDDGRRTKGDHKSSP